MYTSCGFHVHDLFEMASTSDLSILESLSKPFISCISKHYRIFTPTVSIDRQDMTIDVERNKKNKTNKTKSKFSEINSLRVNFVNELG